MICLTFVILCFVSFFFCHATFLLTISKGCVIPQDFFLFGSDLTKPAASNWQIIV